MSARTVKATPAWQKDLWAKILILALSIGLYVGILIAFLGPPPFAITPFQSSYFFEPLLTLLSLVLGLVALIKLFKTIIRKQVRMELERLQRT